MLRQAPELVDMSLDTSFLSQPLKLAEHSAQEPIQGHRLKCDLVTLLVHKPTLYPDTQSQKCNKPLRGIK